MFQPALHRPVSATLAAALLAMPALADGPTGPSPTPVTARPTAPAPSFAGGYAGVTVSSVSLDADWSGPDNTAPAPGFSSSNTADHDPSAAGLGLVAGYRWALGAILLGAEGDVAWADLEETTDSTAFAGFEKRTETAWVMTLTGTLGYPTGRLLPYVEAGIAWAESDYTIIDDDGAAPDEGGSESETRTGWVVGVGLDFMLTDRLMGRVAYNYMDFGEADLTIAGEDWDIEQTAQTVQIGLIYAF